MTIASDACRLALSGVVLALCFIGTTHAQTPSLASVTPNDLDVAGIKLGMTPDQAIAALKVFDAHFFIEKDYEQNPPQGVQYGDRGISTTQLSTTYSGTFLPIGVAPLVHIGALDMTPPCTTSIQDCLQSLPVYELIDVFSPAPGEERVIAVLRTKYYDTTTTNSLPPLSELQSAVFTKYPQSPSLESSDKTSADWFFDSKKRFVSSGRAAELDMHSNNGSLPSSVSPGDGIGLSVKFSPDSSNSGLTDNFSIALYDANALYNFPGQVTVIYNAAKAKLDAAAVQNAAKNAPKTNF